MPRRDTIELRIIVSVNNHAEGLAQCLAALRASSGPDSEIIVVDDGSADESPAVAARRGVRLLRLPKKPGPAVARNHGAQRARGDVLFFADADVVVASGAVAHVQRAFADHPAVAAVFGSHDSRPRAEGNVSQYRNPLHHVVHQQGNPEASTFWAGCGAVHRAAFEKVGGFDAARFPPSSIEDIDHEGWCR